MSVRALFRVVAAFLLAWLADLSLASRLATSQATSGRSAAISGVVVDGSTGAPVPEAVVHLGSIHVSGSTLPPRQLTDSAGRFLFRQLGAASGYFLIASKPGYLASSADRGTRTPQIDLKDDEWVQDVVLRVYRTSSVSGIVSDERGEPVAGVPVRVLAAVRAAGREQWAAGPTSRTNDVGAFRISGLPAGRYVVQLPNVQIAASAGYQAGRGTTDLSVRVPLTSATEADGSSPRAFVKLIVGRYLPLPPGDSEAWTYPPLFFPQVRDVAHAEILDLRPGDSRRGVDFVLKPEPARQIRGSVTGAPSAVGDFIVRLLPPGLEHLANGSEVGTALVDHDGLFALVGVPTGRYVLEVRTVGGQLEYRPSTSSSTSLPAAGLITVPTAGTISVPSTPPGAVVTAFGSNISESFWGRALVTVGQENIDRLFLPLQRLASISGRFVWEGSQPRPTPPVVAAEPADGDAARGAPRSRPQAGVLNEFAVHGLLPGAYVLRVIGGGAVKSITHNGLDYSAKAIEVASATDVRDVVIIISQERAVLRGSVHGVSPAGHENVVLVFSVDDDAWTNYGFSPRRIAAVPVSATGQFLVENLQAGDYFAVAVGASDRFAWENPVRLRSLATRARRVVLAWGRETSVTLDPPVVSR
jgi:hypothetical protein